VSATVIVMVVTGAFTGGLVGLILGSIFQLSLAIVAAFAAVIVAFLARHLVFSFQGQLSFPPALSLLYVIISLPFFDEGVSAQRCRASAHVPLRALEKNPVQQSGAAR